MHFDIMKEDRVETSTSSKGNQMKWKTYDGIWLKVDDMGYEGLAESVASRVLKNTNILDYVEYRVCTIRDYETRRQYRGCASNNFLREGQELVTLERLLTLNGFSINKEDNQSLEDFIKTMVKNVERITKIKNFGRWLCKLIEFDYIIMNEDRHFHNICVIKERGEYDIMPVFDNGLSLMSDTRIDYPLEVAYKQLTGNYKTKPFHGDPEKQLKAVHNLYGKNLNIKETGIKFTDLEKELYSEKILDRIEWILTTRINKYHKDYNCENNEDEDASTVLNWI